MYSLSRALSISAMCVVAASAFAQYDDPALQKEIDFAIPAGSARVAIEALAKASGQTLLTGPQLANESLYINVTQVKLADLMKRIAEATSGEWRAESGGYRLIRPVGVTNAQFAAERQERINKIRASIAKRIEDLKPKPRPSGSATKVAAPMTEGEDAAPIQGGMGIFGGGDEAERTITKLLSMLDPSAIADLQKGDRVVFSTSPTRMQRPIYGNVAPIIAEFIQAHNAKTSAQRNNPQEEGVDMEEVRGFLDALGMSRDEKPVDVRPAKVNLAIARGGGGFMAMMGGIQIELVLYSDKGEVLLRGQSVLSDGESIFEELMQGFGQAISDTTEAVGEALAGEKPKETKQDVPGPDGDIEFSATTKEVATIFGSGSGGMGGFAPKKMTPELEKLMLRPDLHDPLSFAESESLDAIAKIKSLDVVANIPDGRLSMFSMFTGGAVGGAKTKVNQYATTLLMDKRTISKFDGSWFTVRPSHPVASRAERVDRVALARLVYAASVKELPSLDDYAEYAKTNESPMETPAAMLYLALFAPNALSGGITGMMDWNMIRFYSSLNPTQRMGMKNGYQVAMLNLEPVQKTLLSKMLFGANANLEVGPPSAEDEPMMLKMMRGFMGGGSQKSWKEEPTEVMPNGLPNDGQAIFTSSQSMVARVGSDNELSQMFGALGPDELAMFSMFKDASPEMQGQMPTIDSLKIGTRTSYRFQFVVAPDVSTSRSLNDDNVAKDAPNTSLDNIPEAFKAQIAKRAEQLKKSPFFKMITTGIRGSTPPPSNQR